MSRSMLYPTTFVLADGVDLAAGAAEAWRWDGPGVDEVAALARRLGVTGSPVAVPADQGGGWMVGDPMAGASLTVASRGAWSGSAGEPSTVVSSADCVGRVVVDVEPGAPEGGPVVTTVDDLSDCVDAVAEPPSVLPTDDEVLATATTIFGDGVTVGVDWRDEWSVSVSAEYLVDGQPAGQLGYYATYGSGWFASGILGTPVRQGRYPTVSAAAAVARLTDSPLGLGLVRAGGDVATSAALGNDVVDLPTTEPMAEPAPMIDPMPVIEPAPMVKPMPGEVGSMPAEPGVVPEPMPLPEPMPAPDLEPTELVLVSVAPTLVPFFDGTGAHWSLPGYVFTDTEGGEWEVVAVSDEYFDEPAEVPDDVVVDLPVDGDTPVDDGGGGGSGSGVVVPPPGSGDTPLADPAPGALDGVLGLTEGDAVMLLEQAGYTVRVVQRDDEMFAVTRDYRTDRANLVVMRGLVVDAGVG